MWLLVCIPFQIALAAEDPAEPSYRSACISEALDQNTAQQKLTEVQSAYQKLSTFSAAFQQISYLHALEFSEESRGSVSFERPGKMHWHYRSPEEQSFLSDGESFWFYQPKQKQVVVESFEQAFRSDLPVGFLLGVGKLDESFELLETCEIQNSLWSLKFRARKPSQLDFFFLEVAKSDHLPRTAVTLDKDGNWTRLKLLELNKNVKLRAELFEFSRPQDVDLIDRRQLR